MYQKYAHTLHPSRLTQVTKENIFSLTSSGAERFYYLILSRFRIWSLPHITKNKINHILNHKSFKNIIVVSFVVLAVFTFHRELYIVVEAET